MLNVRIPSGMGIRKRARKVYGKSAHYWREEMKPLLLAAACVDIAVKHSKEASVIYHEPSGLGRYESANIVGNILANC